MMHRQGVRISLCFALVIIAAAFIQTPWTSRSGASAVVFTPQDQPAKELWRELEAGSIATLAAGRRPWATPKRYRAFLLNESGLTARLAGAPKESTTAAQAPENEIVIPMPDGKSSRFHFVESPIMEPALAARFPEIKTYRAWGIDDPAATGRFARTSGGFYATLFSPQGASYVAPLFQGDTSLYASYDARDAGGQEAPCTTLPGKRGTAQSDAARLGQSIRPSIASGSTFRTYRLAVAATGEYSNVFGGTVAATMNNGIVPTVNNVAAIYEAELAVSFTLVGNNQALIWTNPLNDPYTNGNTNLMLDENQDSLDSLIGEDNYDIGHVFDMNSVGGRASVGVVCNDGDEGQGTSGQQDPSPGSSFDLMVAHEFGHQFGAEHTFNGTLNNCNTNRNDDTAYEPGSGSTIMAYPGLCDSDNIQGSKSPYFHGMSLAAMADYINNSGGCASTSNNNNTPPNVTPPFPNQGFYAIPGRTPFALTASATDAEDSNLTYCWEEVDNGSPGPPTSDRGDNPLFRSFPGTSNPTRTFPQMSDILSGTTTKGETLPRTDRWMTFIVTARDNHTPGGGFNQGAVLVSVSGQRGPFAVTAPTTGAQLLEGQSFNITWDVASTDLRPISTSSVRILLSTDDGATFPITLAASTQNDGSFTVTAPHANTRQARIKIEAIDNIFFNVSRAFAMIPRPAITTTGSLTITAGGPSVTGPVATVADGRDAAGSLTVVITTTPLPIGVTLSVNNNNGTVSVTGTAQCVSFQGTHSITLRVTNSAGLTNSSSFNLIVLPNPGPTLGNYGNVSVTASQAVVVTPSAPPGDSNNNLSSISVSTTTPPLLGTTLTPELLGGTIRISTSTFTEPKIYEMRVEVHDSCGLWVTRTFFLTVLNSPPQITINTSSPARTTQGGTSVAPAGIASVSDQQDARGSLVVSATPPAAGLTVSVTNSNGAISATVTATCAVVPGTYVGTLTVTDSAGAPSSAAFSIIVDPNLPPTLGHYNNTGVTVGGSVVVIPTVPPSDPNNPVGLTVSVSPLSLPGGGILVPNSTNGRITVTTGAGTMLATYMVKVTARDACGAQVTETFLLTVRSAACDTERSIAFVADTGNHRIQRFNGVNWNVIGPGTPGSGLGQFTSPESVVVSPDGRRIYVADTGNRRIQWSQDSGGTWAVFAGSLAPQGLALDRDGNLYVSDANDNRVIRYSGGVPGIPLALATNGAGAGQVRSPNGLAIDCRMTLYVADTGNNRILAILTADAQVLANTGTVVAASGAGLNPAQVSAPQGVAVDGNGKLYVADTGNDRVLLIATAPAPGPATVLCTVGGGLGQVRGPEGVTIAAFQFGALAGGSSIVVSDTTNNRIQGSLLPAATWVLLPPPAGGGPGAAVGQFKLPSKVR